MLDPSTIPIQAPPGFDAAEAFGPWFAGSAVDLLLMGAILALVVEYWRTYAFEDRLRVRILVSCAALLNFLKSISVAAIVWHKLITGWGNFRMALTSSPWYAAIDPLFTVVISLTAQAFFLLRLRALLKGLQWTWLLVLIFCFMLLSLAAHIGLTVQMFHLGSHEDLEKFKHLELAGMIGMIGTDILLTTSLCYCLFKSKTGVARTDSLISKLILISWSTALLPSVADIVKIALFFHYLRRSSSFITFSLMESKLYTLSMLITLNIRNALRHHDANHVMPSTSYELRGTRTGISGTRTDALTPSTHIGSVGLGSGSGRLGVGLSSFSHASSKGSVPVKVAVFKETETDGHGDDEEDKHLESDATYAVGSDADVDAKRNQTDSMV